MKSFIQIGLGVALGVAVAMIIGSGGLWLVAGIVIGVVVGGAVTRRKLISAVPSAGNKRRLMADR